MTNPMTPTELRKQLVKSLSTAQVESVDDTGEAVIEYEADRLLQLITADRKCVALEARINELNNVRDMDLSLVSHNRVIDRIAELKAQQEEV